MGLIACESFTPATATDFANRDEGRLVGRIAQALAVSSPYINIIGGGTFENGISDTQKVVIQEPASPADSMVNPEFTNLSEDCGKVPDTSEEVGSTVYEYNLESKKGLGPRVCVNQGRSAFAGSYLMAEDSLRKVVTEYINADVRWNLVSKSGTKVVVKTGTDLDTLLTGGEQQLSAAFSTLQPNGQPSFQFIQELCNVLSDQYLAPMTGTGVDEHYTLIGSRELIQSYRRELDVRQDFRAFTQGGFKVGTEMLKSYTFLGPYQGVAFGIDQRPLRASAVVNGVPTYVEPYISEDGSKGKRRRLNPNWVAAPFEVAMLMAEGSFERLAARSYTGEGSFKFSPQLAMGELEWHYVKDNGCNMYGEFGWHKYQILRAYKPVRPHWIIPILFKRCTTSLGLSSCAVNTL